MSGGPTPAAKAGFNAAEQAAIRNVSAPGLTADTLRAIGKLAPTDPWRGLASLEDESMLQQRIRDAMSLTALPRRFASGPLAFTSSRRLTKSETLKNKMGKPRSPRPVLGWGAKCRNRLLELQVPNAFGSLLRLGGWRLLPGTPLKRLTSSTSHTDGSP